MKLQIKCIHIYDFTGSTAMPPLASGFIYQEEKAGKPPYICISIQTVLFKHRLEPSINSESDDLQKSEDHSK